MPPSDVMAPSRDSAPLSSPRYSLRDRQSIRPLDRFGFAGAIPAELSFYRDVVHHEWQHAMVEELAALKRTSTWDFAPLPPHARLITCKWAYKVKTRFNSSLECYKARLVARDF